MQDLAAFEGVGLELGFRCVQTQLVARHEPMQVAPLGTDRTVAIHHLLEVALDLYGNPSTMASALVSHFNSSCP